jgi:hypothetical protein
MQMAEDEARWAAEAAEAAVQYPGKDYEYLEAV